MDRNILYLCALLFMVSSGTNGQAIVRDKCKTNYRNENDLHIKIRQLEVNSLSEKLEWENELKDLINRTDNIESYIHGGVLNMVSDLKYKLTNHRQEWLIADVKIKGELQEGHEIMKSVNDSLQNYRNRVFSKTSELEERISEETKNRLQESERFELRYDTKMNITEKLLQDVRKDFKSVNESLYKNRDDLGSKISEVEEKLTTERQNRLQENERFEFQYDMKMNSTDEHLKKLNQHLQSVNDSNNIRRDDLLTKISELEERFSADTKNLLQKNERLDHRYQMKINITDVNLEEVKENLKSMNESNRNGRDKILTKINELDEKLSTETKNRLREKERFEIGYEIRMNITDELLQGVIVDLKSVNESHKNVKDNMFVLEKNLSKERTARLLENERFELRYDMKINNTEKLLQKVKKDFKSMNESNHNDRGKIMTKITEIEERFSTEAKNRQEENKRFELGYEIKMNVTDGLLQEVKEDLKSINGSNKNFKENMFVLEKNLSKERATRVLENERFELRYDMKINNTDKLLQEVKEDVKSMNESNHNDRGKILTKISELEERFSTEAKNRLREKEQFELGYEIKMNFTEELREVKVGIKSMNESNQNCRNDMVTKISELEKSLCTETTNRLQQNERLELQYDTKMNIIDESLKDLKEGIKSVNKSHQNDKDDILTKIINLEGYISTETENRRLENERFELRYQVKINITDEFLQELKEDMTLVNKSMRYYRNDIVDAKRELEQNISSERMERMQEKQRFELKFAELLKREATINEDFSANISHLKASFSTEKRQWLNEKQRLENKINDFSSNMSNLQASFSTEKRQWLNEKQGLENKINEIRSTLSTEKRQWLNENQRLESKINEVRSSFARLDQRVNCKYCYRHVHEY